ncbi:short-chain dehydrogenase [Evansella cellulosilytica]|uniref:Short chain dehydrogenase n=1 Tax=Evansella cellulosilytica (strain ATCC 21833 / DSM 2522 / FERM P-1141 / JCM 9156 / N-4) TaxID=649639 RepID=E6TWD7_EVAC2|nr:short-chain dehydrogenase [Evansella cellulosilytica]ADU31093.1 short chain dehydrogenase [Evansella cellulosilytica DSM 2522]
MQALVIGGTGMLSEATLWLCRQGYHVHVIARNKKKMKNLIYKVHDTAIISPLYVDYRDNENLRKVLKQLMQEGGHIDLVVSWIHADGKNAFNIVNEEVSALNQRWSLYHVLGSSSDLKKIEMMVSLPEYCSYYQVQLGFVIENDRSRWLTHEEISKGVIDAIKGREKCSVIGSLEPWDKRP